ncbi:16260_t:CDS:2, partial [Acaulospora morrowiae]
SALRKRKSIPVKKEELINAIRDEWNNLSQEYLRTLISSMPNRYMTNTTAASKNSTGQQAQNNTCQQVQIICVNKLK